MVRVRRQAVAYVQEEYGLSERGACRALKVSRASHRYESRRAPQEDLLAELRRLAIERPRLAIDGCTYCCVAKAFW